MKHFKAPATEAAERRVKITGDRDWRNRRLHSLTFGGFTQLGYACLNDYETIR